MLAVAPPPPTERQHLIAQARSALLCRGPQPAPPGGGQTWSIGRESAPRRGPLLPDLQPRSPAMGLKDGNHLTAAARLQPTVSGSDSLLTIEPWIVRSWQRCLANGHQPAQPLAFNMVSAPAVQRTADQHAALLQAAAQSAGRDVKDLTDLPLVSSKTLDWVALLDGELNLVGWAPVDGF